MLEPVELLDLEMYVSAWRMQDVIIGTLACMHPYKDFSDSHCSIV